MATQTVKTSAPAGVDGAKVFVLGTDTVTPNGVATSVMPGVIDRTFYTIVFTDLAAGDYRIVLYAGAVEVLADGVTVGATTGELWGDVKVADVSESLADIDGKLATLLSADVLVQYPWNRYKKELRLTRGSSYKRSHNRAIQFQPTDKAGAVISNAWPNLTGWTIKLGAGQNNVRDLITGTGSVLTPTGNQMVDIEFTTAELEKPTGLYYFELQATNGSDKIDLARGRLVLEDGNAE